VTSDLDFKVTTFFEVEYQKNGHVLKTKLLLYKRKVYLPYGMVIRLPKLVEHDVDIARCELINFIIKSYT